MNLHYQVPGDRRQSPSTNTTISLGRATRDLYSPFV